MKVNLAQREMAPRAVRSPKTRPLPQGHHMLRKHAACETRSCFRCAVHNVKNKSVDARATGFTKSEKWHVCDSAALLPWHVLIVRWPPMLLWNGASRNRHHMLETSRSITRHSALQLKRSVGDGEVELGQVQQKLDRDVTWLCCQEGKLGGSGKKWPLVRHGPD